MVFSSNSAKGRTIGHSSNYLEVNSVANETQTGMRKDLQTRATQEVRLAQVTRLWRLKIHYKATTGSWTKSAKSVKAILPSVKLSRPASFSSSAFSPHTTLSPAPGKCKYPGYNCSGEEKPGDLGDPLS